MAKESGLGAAYFVDGYDLSSDTNALSKISKAMDTLPFTGINKSAHERKGGQLTAEISWMSFFNPTNAHPALATRPRTDRIASYWHRSTIGTPVAAMAAKQINYDPNRGNKGELMFTVQALSNAYWLDWGLGVTAARRVDAVGTSGAGVDFGVPGGAFGAQFYLHVNAFTGTSVTVKLQQSSDNGVGDAWTDVTGGGFTAVTAGNTAQRIQTARNQAIERYLRVVTTGTFSNADFNVSATVNITDMTI